MLNLFRNFITENLLFNPEETILLAVSGGIDSVVMTELFSQAGYRFGIAHCNFGLRGNESDEDEKFVKKLAAGYEVPVFIRRYTRKDFQDIEGSSVQMAARELRYRWFQELTDQEGFTRFATAHHLDDQAETFFINLIRGTGIAGLHGIIPLQGVLIRPMLFATHDQIKTFCNANKLSYREDSSNLSSKYLRNRIRLELMPVLKEINPNIISSMTDTILRIRESESIAKKVISEKRDALLEYKEGITEIDIARLETLDPIHAYMWELISPFGFNRTQVTNILKCIRKPGGKSYRSSTHRLDVDRGKLVIAPLRDILHNQQTNFACFSIEKGAEEIEVPIHLTLLSKEISTDYRVPASPLIASLDFSKLEFPMYLRKWNPGDSFYPYGLNTKKKLSDFFIDNKVSRREKENIWLLCSGTRIAWVVGHRIDNRFRITGKTKMALEIKLLVRL